MGEGVLLWKLGTKCLSCFCEYTAMDEAFLEDVVKSKSYTTTTLQCWNSFSFYAVLDPRIREDHLFKDAEQS